MRTLSTGYNTYIIAVGIVAMALAGFLTGEATLQEAINQMLMGLGIGALRAGVRSDGYPRR